MLIAESAASDEIGLSGQCRRKPKFKAPREPYLSVKALSRGERGIEERRPDGHPEGPEPDRKQGPTPFLGDQRADRRIRPYCRWRATTDDDEHYVYAIAL